MLLKCLDDIFEKHPALSALHRGDGDCLTGCGRNELGFVLSEDIAAADMTFAGAFILDSNNLGKPDHRHKHNIHCAPSRPRVLEFGAHVRFGTPAIIAAA